MMQHRGCRLGQGARAFPRSHGTYPRGKVLNAVCQAVPWLIGGAADLFPSTKTRLTFEGAGDFEAGAYGGRNFHFGIREHAMTAICNGMSLSKVRPFGAGFFIFSDYARGSIRLSALMELPVIHIFTHDSIGLGEDGPTHQPIEQLASLRAMPHLMVMRPADANEVLEAWRVILPLQHRPVALVLSRQRPPRARATPPRRRARSLRLADAPGSARRCCSGRAAGVACVGAERLVARASRPAWSACRRGTSSTAAQNRDRVIPPGVRARVSVRAATFGWGGTRASTAPAWAWRPSAPRRR